MLRTVLVAQRIMLVLEMTCLAVQTYPAYNRSHGSRTDDGTDNSSSTTSPSPIPPLTTTPSHLPPRGTTCTDTSCRNGQCVEESYGLVCRCGDMYTGPRCQFINMNVVHYAIINEIVIFQWSHPPRLVGYSFVYYDKNDPDTELFSQRISIKLHETAALLKDLKNVLTEYRICIEEDAVSDHIVTYRDFSGLSSCLDVHTHWDYYSSFGWVVVFICCVSGIFVIYTGRQNMEILYFGSKSYVDKAQHDNLTLILENLNAYNNGTDSFSSSPYRLSAAGSECSSTAFQSASRLSLDRHSYSRDDVKFY